MSKLRFSLKSFALTQILALGALSVGLLLTIGIVAGPLASKDRRGLSAAGVTPFDAEVRTLKGLKVKAPPSRDAIQKLVETGFPKSVDDGPRARASHATLNAWGHEVLVKAFLFALEPNQAIKRALAKEVRDTMLVFVEYGTYFGDPNQRPFDYGNVNLELVWFLGNLTRAVQIMDQASQDPKSGIQGILSNQDKMRFIEWLKVLDSRYTSPRVFPSGKSNRKASQYETMLRSATLRKDHAEVRRLITKVIPEFINISVNEKGIIPEDTPRDKYHPQFFLASVLQSLEIGKLQGIYLDWKKPTEKLAINRLASALAYSAFTNMDALPPKGFEKMQDPRPNYEIPFWYLAPRFYQDYGLPVPGDVLKMVGFNYADSSRFDFALMWGFNAIAVAKGL